MNKIDLKCQSKLASIINSFNQTIVILNAEGRIMHFNQRAEALVNCYSSLKLEVGRSMMEYLLDSEENLLKAEIENVLKGIGNTFELNMNLSENGDTQWFEFSFAPIVEDDLLIGASLMSWSVEKRKQAELKMCNQLAFEQLIASLASKFVTLNDVKQAINSSLEDMCVFSNASRAYIFEFNADKTHMDNTFEWCNVGVNPKRSDLQGLPMDLYPWWMAKLEKNEIIDIQNINQLPAEASAEKEILQQQNIKSVLVLPLLIKQELSGFIGFDNSEHIGKWNLEDVTLLKITSEIFSHAFERRRAEEDLWDYNIELESTLELLQKAQAQIIQQERLVGVGHLAAGVAHEINNPLGYVLSNIDVLKQNINVLGEVYQIYEDLKKCTLRNGDITTPINKIEALHKKYYIEEIVDDLEDLLGDIDEGLHRVSKIVNSLKAFSRVDQIDEFCQYDLNEGIKNTLMMANSELKQFVEVETKFANIPLIMCIGSQINQVLLNLILNSSYAIKHNLQQDIGKLYIETKSDQTYVYCKIKDNGGGLSSDDEKSIFTPFYTSKPVGVGTGLGLSMAYDIVVNKHKGRIDVDNESGKGVTFHITLPIMQ